MNKKPIPLKAALRLADAVVDALSPHCRRIEVAGSIRRQCPQCGDLDLVVQAPTPTFWNRLAANTTPVESGPQNTTVRLRDGFEIGVYVARQERKNLFGEVEVTDNFGTLLLCRTGSKFFNIAFATYARARGYHWNPYQGLYRGNTCLASATEDHLFEALDLPTIPPENRHDGTRLT